MKQKTQALDIPTMFLYCIIMNFKHFPHCNIPIEQIPANYGSRKLRPILCNCKQLQNQALLVAAASEI